MLEALWSIEFRSSFGLHGNGVAVFDAGRVLGGDSMMIYVGSFEVKPQDEIWAKISVSQYAQTPGMASVVGLDNFTLMVTGKPNHDRMKLLGYVVEAPERKITMIATRRAELTGLKSQATSSVAVDDLEIPTSVTTSQPVPADSDNIEPKGTRIAGYPIPGWAYLYFLWLIVLMWLGSFDPLHCFVVLVIGLISFGWGYFMAEAQIFWIVDSPNPDLVSEEEVKAVGRKMDRAYWQETIKAHAILLCIYLFLGGGIQVVTK